MSSTFSNNKSHLLSNTPTPPTTTKHWSQTIHETVLSSNDPDHCLQLSIGGGSENGQFIFINESVSILRSKPFLSIVKGSKIDVEEILLDVDQQSVAGATLDDVEQLIKRNSVNGKSILLRTVKSGNLHISPVIGRYLVPDRISLTREPTFNIREKNY